MSGRVLAVAAVLMAAACHEKPPAPQPPMSPAERLEYRRNVVVTITKVTPIPGPAGRPPIVRVIGEIANNGDRELGTVHLVFSFRGTDGRVMQEESFFPILVGGAYNGGNMPLKPNEPQRFDVDFNVAVDLTANLDVRVEAVQPVTVTELLR
jgi:hypothetical protein